jgi:hypothetical protein
MRVSSGIRDASVHKKSPGAALHTQPPGGISGRAYRPICLSSRCLKKRVSDGSVSVVLAMWEGRPELGEPGNTLVHPVINSPGDGP